MTDNLVEKHAALTKNAWRIYYSLAAVVIVFLVLVVAQDNEERLFFGLMGSACASVFRPTNKFMNKQILKFTGVAKPEEPT